MNALEHEFKEAISLAKIPGTILAAANKSGIHPASHGICFAISPSLTTSQALSNI
jgi:hypothetical protein